MKRIITTFSFFAILLVSLFFIAPEKVRAECVVNSAFFRTSNQAQVDPNNWYFDNFKPYIYVDVVTTGCAGEAIEFSLTEWDHDEDEDLLTTATMAILSNGVSVLLNTLDTNGLQFLDGGWNDDDVNGTDISLNFNQNLESLNGANCNTSAPFCIDNRPFVVPATGRFTAAMIAGEDECEQPSAANQSSTANCVYYIRINNQTIPANSTDISQVSTLRYNCNGVNYGYACNEDWNFKGWIPYGETHDDDPINNPTQGGGSVTISGVTQVDVDLLNPIGDNNMTIVDVIVKIIKFAITVGIPLVAIAIIYSGLLFVTARGNDAQLETAKNAFTFAVIGGAILLGSWIFAKLIKDVIEGIVMVTNYFV